MPLAGGAVAANERFNRLVWGKHATEGTPHGLIAGGLVDGSVNLYNPARIIGSPIGSEPSDGSGGALVTKMQKHTGPVRGLEFNGFSPNLLASGAEDGELCIWDLNAPATPSLYPPLKGGSGAPDTGEVSYLAWNNKVQHILASSSLNGTTVVWDLKRQRPVISFTDPNSRRRCSALQWNPEVATQLIVASDDDRSPTLQVWDLRNSISPARVPRTLQGRARHGVVEGRFRLAPDVREGQPHALLGHERGRGPRGTPGELQLELRRAVVHDHARGVIHELLRRPRGALQSAATRVAHDGSGDGGSVRGAASGAETADEEGPGVDEASVRRHIRVRRAARRVRRAGGDARGRRRGGRAERNGADVVPRRHR